MIEIRLKRTYDAAADDDGYRVLVDKLWPRGLSHATFHYDLWEKQIAPSDELRHWFHSDPVDREAEFNRRYEAELHANPALPGFIAMLAQHPVVTFLYSSRDRSDNNATVLREVVMAAMAKK